MTSEANVPARANGEDGVAARIGAAGGILEVRWPWVFGGFFFLVPVSRVVAPQIIVAILLSMAALATFANRRAIWRHRWVRPDRDLAVALGGLLALCAVASIWSFEPPRALLLSGRIAILFAAGLIFYAVQRRLDGPARTRAGTWFLAGMALAIVFLYAEPALDYPILGLFGGWMELPANPEILLNRAATTVAILCWPACAILWRRAGATVALCLPVAVFGALAFLSSQAAGFGMVAAAAVAATAGTHRRAGRIVLVVATLGAMVASPLAGKSLYEAHLQDAKWLPLSAAHRVEIWHFTAQRIAERPVFGWGFDAARGMKRLSAEREPSGRNPIALHPHNAPLQILLELGAVGAIFALAVAWVLIQRLESLPKRERILGQATYAAALAISCTAYGLWQNQWLALLISAALAVSLTAPASGRKSIEATPEGAAGRRSDQ